VTLAIRNARKSVKAFVTQYFNNHRSSDLSEIREAARLYALNSLNVPLRQVNQIVCRKTLKYVIKTLPKAATVQRISKQCTVRSSLASMSPEARLQRKRELATHMLANPTPSEEALYRILSRSFRLYGFKPQQVVYGYIPDVYSEYLKLVLEVDGSSHKQKGEYDRKRDLVFAKYGISTMRFTADEVLGENAGIVVGKIVMYITERSGGWGKLIGPRMVFSFPFGYSPKSKVIEETGICYGELSEEEEYKLRMKLGWRLPV